MVVSLPKLDSKFAKFIGKLMAAFYLEMPCVGLKKLRCSRDFRVSITMYRSDDDHENNRLYLRFQYFANLVRFPEVFNKSGGL